MSGTDRHERLRRLSPEQRARLFAALAEEGSRSRGAEGIPRRPPGETTVLSFQQQRLWFIAQLAPGSAYNIGLSLELFGRLDAAALRHSLDEIERRHEVLRTVYRVLDGRPVQRVLPPRGLGLPVVDLRGLKPDRRHGEEDALGGRLARRSFDLEAGPLLRLVLLAAERDRVRLLCCVHHIVFDGWSQEVLIAEAAALYGGRVQAAASGLEELPVQYADYAVWQRRQLAGESLERLLRAERERLAGAPALLDLPNDRPRPAIQSFLGAERRLGVPGSGRNRLTALGRRRQATLFMVLLASFKLLLARLSGVSDLVVGTPSTRRQRPELERLIGCFVNTLVVRTDLSGDPSFEGLVDRVRDAALDAFDRQELPFEILLDALRVERTFSHSPLFQVMFVLQNAPERAVDAAGLELRLGELETGSSKFDLNLGVAESDDGLSASLEYDTALFDRATIDRWLACWQALLVAACETPEIPVSRLPMLRPAERHQLLREWNDTEIERPAGTVPEAILRQAESRPEAEAVRFGEEVLSYGDLLRAAAGWGRDLEELGVAEGDTVGVRLDRSLELPVALLACWWAGAAYLPIEPTLPLLRQSFLVSDAGCRAVITATADGEAPAGLEALRVDRGALERAIERGGAAAGAPRAWRPESLAYVIYTSGSTGRPKGVMAPHRGLWNRLRWMQEAFTLTRADRVGQKTPIGFDVSVWELFWPLMEGACLVLARPGMHRDSSYLVSWVARRGISVLHFVPSMLRFFAAEEGLAECGSLRWVVCSGEALPPELSRRFLSRSGAALANLYGPTEASIDVTAYRCGVSDAGVPIGRPIANSRTRVVDRSGALGPLGCAGELCLGGAGLGRGYAGRPGLTAERFVPDPWAERPGERLYRTGDLTRLLPDGMIDYLGRIDFQVKLRGFRVELGEIERALVEHSAIAEAVVAAGADRGGEPRLVAYFVPAGVAAPSVPELRRHLARWLPEHMIPAVFVRLDEMPLGPNGKLDRKALPEPGTERPDLDRVYEPPTSAAEERLTQVFAEVLGIERVGIDDGFFALGGDSMRALQAMTRAAAAGLGFTLQDLYRHPRVRELAGHVSAARGFAGEAVPEAAGGRAFSQISPVDRARMSDDVVDAYPLSRMQAGMLYHMELADGDIPYHNVDSWHLRLTFDFGLLARVLQRQVDLHEVLRTSFDLGGDGQPLQRVHARARLELTLHDLRGLGEARQEEVVRRFVRAEKRRPFDLLRPPLVRFHVHRRAVDRIQLTLVENHAVWDGWSLHSSLADAFRDYFALLAGEPLPPAAPPSLRYRDFVALELATLGSREAREYWDRTLADWPAIELGRSPAASRPPAGPRARILAWPLEDGLRERLRAAARQAAVPLKSLLLAAYLKVLSLETGQREVSTGLVSNGRPEEPGGERVRGLFLNTLPFRMRLGDESWADLWRRSLDGEREVLPHRRYPLAALQERSGRPLFEQSFNYLDFHAVESVLATGSIEVLGMEKAEGTSQKLMAVFDHQGLQLEYLTSELDEGYVGALGERLLAVLRRMVRDPLARHDAEHFLTSREERQVLEAWARGPAHRGGAAGFEELFARQARRTPDRVAVAADGRSLSYGALDRGSAELAERLAALGLAPETRVGLAMDRLPALPMAMIAVLRAGLSYVPLDPAYPAERIEQIVRASRVRLVLSDRPERGEKPAVSLRLGRPDASPAGSIHGRFIGPRRSGPSRPMSLPEPQPEALAYVLFTSGSTGVPKGVAIPRGALAVFLAWGRFAFSPRELSSVLASTSINFDLSVFELLLPLTAGGRVVLARDALQLHELGEAGRVRLINSVPSVVQELLRSGPLPASVETVNLAGEALPRALVESLYAHRSVRRVLNLYGPSEDTTYSTCRVVRREGTGAPAIGRPIAGSRARVLDGALQPVPPAVPGGLFLGGAGLARGYLDRPAGTSERFLPDPFSQRPGGRLYATGDLARWRADGQLEYLGRRDQQVKLRGFRIELGEIEAALDRAPGVAESAVGLETGRAGEPRLVAFVAPGPGAEIDLTAVRRSVARSLPAQMVPSAWVVVERLPRTPNGKLDRRRLPFPDDAGQRPRAPFVPPRGPVEEALALLWGEVLGIERAGRDDDFLALGGHSLLATRLIAQMRRSFGLELPLGLVLDSPTLKDLAARVEETRRRGGPPLPPLAVADPAGRSTLSFAQERLWTLARVDPGGSAYHLPTALRLRGELEVGALAASLRGVAARHQVLRTVYPDEDGAPVARLQPPASLLPVIDLSVLPRECRETKLGALVSGAVTRPFELAVERPWRTVLVRLGAGEHALVSTLHHIAGDAASIEILLGETARSYDATIAGRSAPLEPLDVQYGDFAAWQRSWLTGNLLRSELGFWRARLEGAPERLELPTDRPRPLEAGSEGAGIGFVLGPELREGLIRLARARRATPSMTLLAVFYLLLSRYAGQRDVVVGIPASHRDRPELDRLIGLFINTLALRLEASDDPPFGELVDGVRARALEAYSHRLVPFERLVDELRPARSLAHAPLYQVIFDFQAAVETVIEVGSLQAELIPIEAWGAKVDLTLGVRDRGDDLAGFLEFRTDLFDQATVARMAGHFRRLLAEVVADPTRRLSSLTMLTDAERSQLAAWGGDPRRAASGRAFLERFEEVAGSAPDAVAAIDERSTWTYSGLDARAAAIAAWLRSLGLGPEDRIGLLTRRSAALVASILGAFRVGAAFVPVDPEAPRRRLVQLLTESGARALVVEAGIEAPEDLALPVVEIDGRPPARSAGRVLAGEVRRESLAYLLFTSGSTGRPKGVAVEQRQLAAYLDAVLDRLRLPVGCRFAMVSTPVADLGYTMVFGALASAGQVLFLPDAATGDPARTAEFLERYRADCLKIVPSHLAALLALPAPRRLLPARALILGGEALSWELMARVREAGFGGPVWNEYGPTETTVGVVAQEVETGATIEGSSVPIGRPYSGTRVLLLDPAGLRVPAGVAGELFVGGANVSRGYLGRPAETAARYLPSPSPTEPGDRVYRTGDLARYLPDGRLEFLGRADLQVKIRGFRVEPGEVEAAIRGVPEVRDVVVTARSGADGGLVAYPVLRPGSSLSGEWLAARLREVLPETMVPAAFVFLAELPLTANGKVDRSALPQPAAVKRAVYVPPATPEERMLARAWQEVLGVERIGREDNFFELGGDSISGLQVAARAARQGLRITGRLLFRHQTLRAVAAAGEPVAAARVRPAPSGRVPLTPAQARFFAARPPRPDHANQAALVTAEPALRCDLLERAVALLVRRHAALRSRFELRDGAWGQEAAPADGASGPWPIPTVDLSRLDPAARRDRVRSISSRLQAGLDLSAGRLLTVARFLFGAGERPRVLIAVHHLAIDGVSWRILFDELGGVCSRLAAGEEPPPALPASEYSDWARRLADHASSASVAGQTDFWRERATPGTRLPTDFERRPVTVSSVDSVSVALGPLDTAALQQTLAAAPGLAADDLFLAALVATLADWSGKPEWTIAAEGHGRNELFEGLDLSRTVGWFTSFYPVRLEAAAGVEPVRLLRATKQRLREIPDAGIGYGLLRYLTPDSPLADAAEPEVRFNYLGRLDGVVGGGSLFGPADESCGASISPEAPMEHPLAIDALIADGELRMDWSFSRDLHRRATIESLAEGYLERLRDLVERTRAFDGPWLTPSDVPLAGLDPVELDRLLAAIPGRIEDLFPLSPLQQGLLFHALASPGEELYHEQVSCALAGDLDEDAFERAWRELVARHAVLRTSFHHQGLREPLQAVHETVPFAIHRESWRGSSADERRERLDRYLAEDMADGFVLESPPLMRVALFAWEEGYHLVWSRHHILIDGWAVGVLIRELLTVYEADRRGEAAELAAPYPYRSYIEWVRGRDLAKAEAFWRSSLAGFRETTPLPAASRDRAELPPSERYREHAVLFTPEESRRLRELAGSCRVTLNTLFLGVWSWLLSRHGGTSDVLFGAVTSGRPAEVPELQGAVGLFINTVPVRVRVDDALALGDWLAALQSGQAELLEHEHSPLVQVQGWSEVPSGAPLFESLFVFENFPLAPAEGDTESSLTVTDVEFTNRSSYPLTLVIGADPAVAVRFRFDRSRIDERGLAPLAAHMRTLVTGMLERPASRVGELPWLTGEERAQLLSWRGTGSAAPGAEPVLSRFALAAARRPDAVALVFEDLRLTYGALEARARRLARRLRERGVGSGGLVAVAARRSPDAIVAVVAVLGAGAAYLPLDANQPADRLRRLVADSGADCLLTDGSPWSPAEWARALPEGFPIVAIGSLSRPAPPEPVAEAEPLDTAPPPESEAYVLYTSGSTGRPKGVAVEHRQLSAYVASIGDRLGLPEAASYATVSALAADLGNTMIFGALTTGGCLHLLSDAALADPAASAEVLDREPVDCLKIVPSHLKALLSRAGAGRLLPRRLLVLGGEPFDGTLIEAVRALAPGLEIVNHYGPTETTIGVSTHRIGPRGERADRTVPIGRPLAGARLAVVDRSLRQVAPGIAGEVLIGGATVSRGYLGRAALTAERFVPDPAGETAGARAYRSGDLGRWGRRGDLELLGRTDQQVKIRGYRVEPGEVEAALARHPAVARVAVGPFGSDGELGLAAWFVPAPGTEPDVAGLREYLAAKLPSYMVPTAFVALPELPLNPNGKLDRRALPTPAPQADGSRYRPAESELERDLVEIWQRVLGRERIGIDEDFFSLGGHSLRAMVLVNAVQDRLGAPVPLADLFEAPTVAGLAGRLRDRFPDRPELGAPGGSAVEDPWTSFRAGARAPGERVPLSYAQEQLWFQYKLEPESPAFIIGTAVEFSGRLDVARLAAGFREVVRRHESLRTRFVESDGRAFQLVDPPAPSFRSQALPLVDLGSLGEGSRRAEARRLAESRIAAPFDLGRDRLVRLELIRLDGAGTVAVLTMHHIIADGWSLGLLIRELGALYSGGLPDEVAALPPVAARYADFAVWQRRWLAGPRLEANLEAWRAVLAGAPPGLRLPTDRPRPIAQTFAGRSETWRIPPPVTAELRALSTRSGATLFMVLVAAFKALLSWYSNQHDIVIGSDMAGRNRSELEGVVGFFVNQLPLRTDLSGDPTFLELLARVRTVVIDAFSRQEVPFEKVVEAVRPRRIPGVPPLFQVKLNLQTAPAGAVRMEGLELSLLDFERTTAQLDLILNVEEHVDELAASLQFNTDLFDPSTAVGILRRYEGLLAAVGEAPETRLSQLARRLARSGRKSAAAPTLRARRRPLGVEPLERTS